MLARIRRRLGREAANAAAAAARVDAALAARTAGPRPAAGMDATAKFTAKSLAMSCTLDRIADRAEAPAAVARYLEQQNLPRRGVCWSLLAELDWALAGVEMASRPAVDGDLVGVTACFCAIAETGTLMLCSSPQTPAATSLLPETHIALVPIGRIVAAMEEAWNLARSELGELPRAVNFVSGPSRTGDIEQTIVIGAHGPYRVHIILVGEATG